jgi:hypothetical protein
MRPWWWGEVGGKARTCSDMGRGQGKSSLFPIPLWQVVQAGWSHLVLKPRLPEGGAGLVMGAQRVITHTHTVALSRRTQRDELRRGLAPQLMSRAVPQPVIRGP